MAATQNSWKTALLSQGIEAPRLGTARGAPGARDLVQVTEILFFPPRACPSSGQCELHYQQ